MPSQTVIIGSSFGAAFAVVFVLLMYYCYRRRAIQSQTNSLNGEQQPPTSVGTIDSVLCCCCLDDEEEDRLLAEDDRRKNEAAKRRYDGANDGAGGGQQQRVVRRKSSSFTAGGVANGTMTPEKFKRTQSPRHAKNSSNSGSTTKKPRYKIKKKLGEGAYGVVYLAIRTEDLRQVAVKVVPCQDEGAAEEAMQEYEMMKASQGHENIVTLFDVFFDEPREEQVSSLYGAANAGSNVSNKDSNAPVVLKELGIRTHGGKSYVCIVSEFCEAGTLFDLLLTKRNAGSRSLVCLPEHVIWSYSAQLLRGLDHMHNRNMMHRDLKPSNVLLSESFQKVTLTDFGLSRVVSADEYVQTRTGTMQYLSPEQVQRRYNHKSDIWGIGCLVYAMCTARISNDKARVMFRDRNRPTFDAEMEKDLVAYSPVLLEFMLKLLAKNASDRPTAAQAMAMCQEQLPGGDAPEK